MSDQEKYRILIIEDESSLAEVIIDLLGHDYHCFSTDNGESALNILSEQTFDLIITDLKMPGVEGREILEKTENANTPRIAITGFPTLKKEIPDGVEIVDKPFDPAEFIKLVSFTIENRS